MRILRIFTRILEISWKKAFLENEYLGKEVRESAGLQDKVIVANFEQVVLLAEIVLAKFEQVVLNAERVAS